MIREALTNVRKHSGASRVHVSIKTDNGKLTVIIADNGHGFDINIADVESENGHIGIRSMRERTKIMNGSLSIESESGKGTVVTLIVPIGKSEGKAVKVSTALNTPTNMQ